MSAMFKLSYGLFVVTARDGEKDNGCITNTVQQVTAAPNRISLAVNKANFTHDMILKSGVFNVSIISEKADFELFKRFGFASGRDTDKFAGYGAAERAENGVLYVTNGVNSVLFAQVVQTVDLGTHTLFIADVAGEKVLDETASATYAYYFEHIKPKPEAKPKTKGWVCKICGYVYEGEELPADFICPVCLHPASDFEPLN